MLVMYNLLFQSSINSCLTQNIAKYHMLLLFLLFLVYVIILYSSFHSCFDLCFNSKQFFKNIAQVLICHKIYIVFIVLVLFCNSKVLLFFLFLFPVIILICSFIFTVIVLIYYTVILIFMVPF